MLVKEVLKQISKKEGVSYYRQISLERYISFNENKEVRSHM